MEHKEIKFGNIHCFTDCGFNCKASVLEELRAHYAPILENIGDGWSLREWHNCGWHVELVHKESGFHLKDDSIRGGVNSVKHDDVPAEFRFYCHNYGDGTIGQVRAYGFTAQDAVTNAVRNMRTIGNAYLMKAMELAR